MVEVSRGGFDKRPGCQRASEDGQRIAGAIRRWCLLRKGCQHHGDRLQAGFAQDADQAVECGIGAKKRAVDYEELTFSVLGEMGRRGTRAGNASNRRP
jgi:hypothetical protein